jgi:hypothetical protein
MQGIVLFKEIDGIELAYNPIWELGSLGVDTNTLLGITADSNIKTPADFWMEDVRSLTVDVSELVENGLKEYGIILTPEQEDKIHNVVWEVLESVSNGDYRSYN